MPRADPGLCDYSPIVDRPRLTWPHGARLAVWVAPNLEFYELDPPVGPARPPWPRPHPDVLGYSLRDYGNRVGVWRLFEVLDRHGMRGSVALNVALCEHHPEIVEACRDRGWEFFSHGIYNTRYPYGMDEAQERAMIEDAIATVERHTGQRLQGWLHHAGLGEGEEAALVDEALAAVRGVGPGRVSGWLSPAGAESPRTLDLLAARGIEYVCDWANDDLPYRLRTGGGPLYAMPYAHEIADTTLIWQAHHTPGEWAEKVRDRFDALYHEAGRSGGRVLALPLHPWVIGQPHRIAALEQALDHVLGRPGVWPATGAEILAAFRAQER